MIFCVAKPAHELNITLGFLPVPPQHFAVNGRRRSLKLIAPLARPHHLSPGIIGKALRLTLIYPKLLQPVGDSFCRATPAPKPRSEGPAKGHAGSSGRLAACPTPR